MGLWGPAAESWKIAARLPDLPASEVELPGLEALAIRQRLDLQAAATEVQALAGTLNLTGYTRFPFSTGVHTERESDRDGPINIGPHLEGQIPIFDQGRAKVAGAQAMLRQGMQKYAALAVQVRGEVRRARNRLVAQRAKADYYRRVVIPLRQRASAQTQLEYNGMQIGIFHLLTAKQEEINAGGEYIEALREYWLARTDLEKAVGGRLKGEIGEHAPATQPNDGTMPAPSQAPHHHH
jgi:outer membrane protein, heavy metal efflux system